MDWVLQGVVSLDIHYYSLKSFKKKPFTLKVISQDVTIYNNVVVFVTIGFLIIFCFVLTYIILRCCRSLKNFRNLSRPVNNNNANINNNDLNNIQGIQAIQGNIPNNNNVALINGVRNQNLYFNNFNENNYANFIYADNEDYALDKNNLEILNKLLSSKIQGIKYNEKLNDFKVNCTICLENFSNEDLVIKLFCKHIFHFQCLKDLMLKNRHNNELKCPNCKNDVEFITLENKDKNNTLNANAENRNSDNSNEINRINNTEQSNINSEAEINNLNNQNNGSMPNQNEEIKNKNNLDLNKNKELTIKEAERNEMENNEILLNNKNNENNQNDQIELNSLQLDNLENNENCFSSNNSKENEDNYLESEQRIINPIKSELRQTSFKHKKSIIENEHSSYNNNKTTNKSNNNNIHNNELFKENDIINIQPNEFINDNLSESDIEIDLEINKERNIFCNLNKIEINNENFVTIKNHANYNCTTNHKNNKKKHTTNKKDYIKLEKRAFKNAFENESFLESISEENKTI